MFRHTYVVVVLVAAFELLASFPAARADTVLSNLTNPAHPFISYPIDDIEVGATREGHDQAYSFTAGQEARLDGIRVLMRDVLPQPSGFSVSLANDAAGSPGLTFATLTGHTSPFVGGVYSYVPSFDLLLMPGHTYWVVMSVPHDGSPPLRFLGSGTTDSSFTSSPGWSLGVPASRRFVNGGAFDWQIGTGSLRGMFAIDASIIPEPSTGALAACIAARVLLQRRR